jgi:putative acetyltransferase
MVPIRQIRDSNSADLAVIEQIYREAFPDEDLLPLVRALLQEPSATVSAVAVVAGTIAGHVIFTLGHVCGCKSRVALLGPLAVAPAAQRSGIGRALVDHGCEEMAARDIEVVLVLGDPAYYGRLGFTTETDIAPLYPLPPEWQAAWQSRRLDGLRTRCHGRLQMPQPWHVPALWSS